MKTISEFYFLYSLRKIQDKMTWSEKISLSYLLQFPYCISLCSTTVVKITAAVSSNGNI